MKKLLKAYTFWTYGIFFCFLILIGIVMMVLKMGTLAEALKILSAWTSTIVFVLMFRKIYPKDSLKNFIKRQFSEKIKLSTVLIIILLQLSIFIATLLVKGNSQQVPIKTLLNSSGATLIIVFCRNLIQGPLGEELGWRGFMLNELQKKYNPLKSAIIVGVLWGFWHTPLWFISTGYSGIQLVQYIIYFLVSIISTSIIMTAFYNLNHNLVIPIIIHQLFNYSLGIQAGDILHNLGITALLYFVLAVVLVLVNYKNCLYGKVTIEKSIPLKLK